MRLGAFRQVVDLGLSLDEEYTCVITGLLYPPETNENK